MKEHCHADGHVHVAYRSADLSMTAGWLRTSHQMFRMPVMLRCTSVAARTVRPVNPPTALCRATKAKVGAPMVLVDVWWSSGLEVKQQQQQR
jgi:hypothetical protein